MSEVFKTIVNNDPDKIEKHIINMAGFKLRGKSIRLLIDEEINNVYENYKTPKAILLSKEAYLIFDVEMKKRVDLISGSNIEIYNKLPIIIVPEVREDYVRISYDHWKMIDDLFKEQYGNKVEEEKI